MGTEKHALCVALATLIYVDWLPTGQWSAVSPFRMSSVVTHISGNVICHHAPHETCEFPCDCRFSDIVFLAFIKHHLVVSTSKTFVSFVSINDDCRRIP